MAIVYCATCGDRVTIRTESPDGLDYCAKCAPAAEEKATPTTPLFAAKRRTPAHAPPVEPPSRLRWIGGAVAVALAAVGAGLFFLLRRPSGENPPPQAPASAKAPEPSAAEKSLAAFSSAARSDPSFERVDEIERQARELREKHPEVRDRVDRLLAEYRSAREAAAEQKCGAALREATSLEASGKNADALKVIESISVPMRIGPSWEALVACRRRIESKPKRGWHELYHEAIELQKKQKYAEAKSLLLKAMEVRCPKGQAGKDECCWHSAPYHLAELIGLETAALSGFARDQSSEECRKWFTQAIQEGYAHKCKCHGSFKKHLAADTHFDSVRADDWFRKVEEGLRE